MSSNFPLILLRGGGDLATGVAARLYRSGFGVIVTEIEQPKAVRRLVSLAEAVYRESVEIEELSGKLVPNASQALEVLDEGDIPVLIDPECASRSELNPAALVDGRMMKVEPELGMDAAPLVIGLGPGFTPGVNCHAVVETKRGHHLGRVIWDGPAAENTGVPEPIAGYDLDRVLRAPATGYVLGLVQLGTMINSGEAIAQVGDKTIEAPFDGVLRGLIHEEVEVEEGEKIGDLDPRGDISACFEISDKALAIGGGVLEAVLSRSEIRGMLGS